MRRGVGIQAVHNQTQTQKQLQNVSDQISTENINKIKEQLVIFKENLEQFAIKHKKDITKNPEFRKYFQDMCNMIGVDPLASNKGFWSQVLGVGDFYYTLGVQIIEICLKYRGSNGGLMEMNILADHLRKLRGKNSQEISLDDIETSISKLKVLGNGFNIIKVNKKKLVQSVPCELNKDHTDIIILAQENNSSITESQISQKLKWNNHRINSVLNFLLQESMVWIDDQSTETIYWFPSLWSE
ncbi:hypothetical protein DICPUDRAFT_42052 [Dictyostelium purpureum]|uniref:Vacuolar-sorting protein SNF8 n=1 Tax=Dictyostelium purpureum TaxID=5786 RepID=F1A1A7_DICPU|nr:uncharacterized protein DICPUDRAFT_42052 [Dictyostelium purpureum]EGC30026.1 hypothetical protein DICPUDRAFT_42052 [Dictyostelium purpureum]|eukprot:XP_003293453.1 hypothetical protein DICPUDRAFT_42052 [Dictyostelium purpureum]